MSRGICRPEFFPGIISLIATGRPGEPESLPGITDIRGLPHNPHPERQYSINTDFAQVEADQEIVNVTRFNIFFPEKRDFFIENSGLFSVLTPHAQDRGGYIFQPFYSRTIGLEQDRPIPIVGAAKRARIRLDS